MPGVLVTDPHTLRPGDVVAIGPRAWRVVVDVSAATHPAADAAGAVRVDSLGWESGRPITLTYWPHRGPWHYIGTAAGLGWVAPPATAGSYAHS